MKPNSLFVVTVLTVIFLLLFLHMAQPGFKKGALHGGSGGPVCVVGVGTLPPRSPRDKLMPSKGAQVPPTHPAAFSFRYRETWTLPRLLTFLPFHLSTSVLE